MRELVDATGVNRQTIHYYLRAGLLPPPSEGAGTVRARYTAQHVELIRLIRSLRTDHGLSLNAIRRAFQRAAFEPKDVLAGAGGPAALPGVRDGGRAVDRATLLREAGAEHETLAALLDAGVLSPLCDEGREDDGGEDGDGESFDPVAVEAARAAERLVGQGLSLHAVTRLGQLASSVAGLEATALARDVGNAADLPEAWSQAEQRHAQVTDLLAAVRRAALRRVARQLTRPEARFPRITAEVVYVPSALFARRHHLEDAVRRFEEEAQAGSAASQQRLGRLLLAMGRYKEAEVWLHQAVVAAPEDAASRAYHGVALGLAGNAHAAVDVCRRAVALDPEGALPTALLGTALGLKAASAVGLGQAREALREALEVTEQSRGKRGGRPHEDAEVLLARGRVLTAIPGLATNDAEAVADLRRVVAWTEGEHSESISDLPGGRDLFRLHALFYVGMFEWRDGQRDRARARLHECIALDPASRLAELAYGVLGAARPPG